MRDSKQLKQLKASEGQDTAQQMQLMQQMRQMLEWKAEQEYAMQQQLMQQQQAHLQAMQQQQQMQFMQQMQAMHSSHLDADDLRGVLERVKPGERLSVERYEGFEVKYEQPTSPQKGLLGLLIVCLCLGLFILFVMVSGR
jgi:hypothetical protein